MNNEFMIALLYTLRDAGFAFFVAVGFATLFNTPKKILVVAGILGGLGHCLRFVLHEYMHQGLIFSTLCGCLLIGFAGIYAAHKVHTPPVIFTMPACITMIPGLYAYRAMLGFVKVADTEVYKKDPTILSETFHNVVLTSSLLFCLAIGLSLAVLLFRKQSVKTISLQKKKDR